MNNKHTVYSTQVLHKPLLVAVSVVAVILLLAVTFTNPIIAWFKSTLSVQNPAQLTNFTVETQYRFGTSGTFKTVAAGTPIPVTLDNVNTLQVRVRYCGVATHYIRLSLFGGFYNKNTGTYLPMKGDSQSSLFTATGTSWITSGGYIYYKSMLKDTTEMTEVNAFTVTADTSSWANKSEYQEYAGEVYVLVDAVQANRIQAFWGITALPTA